jgi:hypothetical protein
VDEFYRSILSKGSTLDVSGSKADVLKEYGKRKRYMMQKIPKLEIMRTEVKRQLKYILTDIYCIPEELIDTSKDFSFATYSSILVGSGEGVIFSFNGVFTNSDITIYERGYGRKEVEERINNLFTYYYKNISFKSIGENHIINDYEKNTADYQV